MAQRFHQFGGLIDDCEFKRGCKETTANDLAGFWDMVQFQIDDVSAKFDHLAKLFKNELEMVDTSFSAIDVSSYWGFLYNYSNRDSNWLIFAAYIHMEKSIHATKHQNGNMLS